MVSSFKRGRYLNVRKDLNLHNNVSHRKHFDKYCGELAKFSHVNKEIDNLFSEYI